MNVSRPFIERPIATALLMIAVLLAGMLAYHLLPVSALPEGDYPTIQVYTQYPGASPEVVSSSITSPLERQFGEMPRLKTMDSTSSNGASVITLRFDLTLSLDVAEQEVRAAINASATYLPTTLPYQPIYSKVNPADAPVLTLSLTSNVLPLTKIEDLADTRLAKKISRISGVGLVTISGGRRPVQQAAWANSTPSIVLNIQRQPGANVIDVVDRVQKLLPQLRASLPATVKVAVLTDRTQAIRASVTDVQYELAAAIGLVVMVIFIFLRNIPATVILAVTAPLSLIGALVVVYGLGFSLNNLTLMSLTIATGFVVDNAIVMIENITRYIEAGDKPDEAALKGSKQIGFTIISLSVSLVAVMIPLLFMGDVVGCMFREFALTLAVAIMISAIVSLTLTPMMCSRMLKVHGEEKERRADFFDRLNHHYVRGLDWVLEHRGFTLLSVALTAALTFLVLFLMPKGFFPEQDTGLIEGVSQAAPTISFQHRVVKQQQLVGDILKDPAVASLSSFVGIDQANPTINQGTLLINLKDKSSRSASAEAIRRLSDETANFSGMRLFLHPVQDLTLDDAISTTSYRLGLQATDPDLLNQWTLKLIEALRGDPVFADVQSQALQQGNQVQMTFDRGTVAPLTSMGTTKVVLTPLTINRRGQLPYADVSFNLATGYTLGTAVSHVHDIEAEIGLPPTVHASLEGFAATFQSLLSNEAYLVLAVVFMVYLMLSILFESFVHPVTILSTLPSAALGALLALLITDTQFDIIGLMGIVLLIGIVAKNAIMMIDLALDAQRNQGLCARDAIRRAAELRFRPILMTTMASLFGAVPLAFGSGMGSELRHPLGIAIIGGLMVSQLLTLFSTPVIYLAMHRVESYFARRGRPGAESNTR